MTQEDLLNDIKQQMKNVGMSQAQQAQNLQNVLTHAQQQLYNQQQASILNKPFVSAATIAVSPRGLGINNKMNNDPLEEELENKKTRISVRDLDISTATDTVEKVLKTPIVPFLWGPPGIGKSTLVKEIAKRNNWQLIDLRLSLLNPVDLRGLPVVDKDNQQADWYPPSFLPKFDTKETGILFLDEINLAPLSVQAAAYQLILDKKVGEYRFPPHWRIVAAGNRETDRANVYKLSAPLANRFVHFNMTSNFNTWRNWARENHVRAEILDFLTLRPSLLFQMPNDSEKAFPSPRSWEFMSNLLNAFEYKGSGDITPELQQLIVGTVGDGVGRELIGFMQDWDLQATSRMVEEFIKTGDFTMPKAASLRYAFVTAVFGAHIDGELTDNLYKKFFNKLSGEEKKTLETFEAENRDRLQARKKKATGPNMNADMTFIADSISNTDIDIPVMDGSIFKGNELVIFDTNGNMEYCSYKKVIGNVIVGLTRAILGSTAMAWPKATYIQPI